LRPSNFCIAADIAISSQTKRQLGLCRKPVDISTISQSIDQMKWQPCAVIETIFSIFSTKWQACAMIETIFSDFSQHLHLAKNGKTAFGTLRPSNFCIAADIAISSQTKRQLGLCRKPVDISAVS